MLVLMLDGLLNFHPRNHRSHDRVVVELSIHPAMMQYTVVMM